MNMAYVLRVDGVFRHGLVCSLVLLCLLPKIACAQGANSAAEHRVTTTHFHIGLGASSLYNTYLSPLEYKGEHLMFHYARQRGLRRYDGRWHRQHTYQAIVAQGETPAATATSYQLDLSYATRWLYTYQPLSALHLRAGLGIEAHLGGQYNNRNGNNPATLDAAFYLPLTIQAYYSFHLGRLPLGLYYQLDIPLVGAQWAPNYTQSYYELFGLNARRGVVAAVWLGNIPSWRQQLHVSFPLGYQRITLGVYSDVRQHSLRGVEQHGWHYGISVGYVRQLRIVSAKEKTQTFIY